MINRPSFPHQNRAGREQPLASMHASMERLYTKVVPDYTAPVSLKPTTSPTVCFSLPSDSIKGTSTSQGISSTIRGSLNLQVKIDGLQCDECVKEVSSPRLLPSFGKRKALILLHGDTKGWQLQTQTLLSFQARPQKWRLCPMVRSSRTINI